MVLVGDREFYLKCKKNMVEKDPCQERKGELRDRRIHTEINRHDSERETGETDSLRKEGAHKVI